MRNRRRITTDKLYEVYFIFLQPTAEKDFKNSSLYKKIKDFISANELIQSSEYYQSLFESSDDLEDYDLEPDFYRFNFLVKNHASEFYKAFKAKNTVYKLEQAVLDTEGECWWHWPEVEHSDNPWLPDGCDSYDDCMEIYGDIPGNRD